MTYITLSCRQPCYMTQLKIQILR